MMQQQQAMHHQFYIPMKYYQKRESARQSRSGGAGGAMGGPQGSNAGQPFCSSAAEQALLDGNLVAWQKQDEQFKKNALNMCIQNETIQLNNGSEPSHVNLVMPKEAMRQLQSFKPFLESATPSQKLDLLTKTSVIRPKRRVQKLLAKEAAAVKGVKCPVYKCEGRFVSESQLEAHYAAEHGDLIKLGLMLADNSGEGGQLGGVIKDQLLTQIIAFCVANKPQVRRFQIDFEQEVLARHKHSPPGDDHSTGAAPQHQLGEQPSGRR